MATKKKKTMEVKALVIREIAMTQRQATLINAETPAAFIKEKPGRGGRKVAYVEGGYIINQLNGAFSPLGWDFEILDQGQTERKLDKSDGEVWVRGRLVINDHKNGFKVYKTQYGQHAIHANVPIGDAYKAAATDALKKCASMLGIAQDVYWGGLDSAEEAPAPAKGSGKVTASPAERFERAKAMVRSARDVGSLIEWDEKLKTNKVFTAAQKSELSKLIKGRVTDLEGEQA
jgi:hypothetical protein